jgi:hypothetical protein
MVKFNFAKKAKASVDAHGVAEFLNQLLSLDASAVNSLVKSRVPCNEALMQDPFVQISEGKEFGVLGLINGILLKAEESRIVGIWENDKLIRFQIREEVKQEDEKK